MSTIHNRRALRFVLKTGSRRSNYNFFVNILGMTVLRHEEFEKATCIGPYDGRWSKTMIGFGPEDKHFALELVYNYGIRHYALGDDFKGITIHSSSVFKTFGRVNYIQRRPDDDTVDTLSCDRYPFTIINRDKTGDPIVKVSLASSDLEKTVAYWSGKLGMTVLERGNGRVLLSYGNEQCQVEFISNDGKPVEHAEAFGRMVFSCPHSELAEIESAMRMAGRTILKPLTTAELVLADPDGHEIAFVGDEMFKELSKLDPNANRLLCEAMDADK